MRLKPTGVKVTRLATSCSLAHPNESKYHPMAIEEKDARQWKSDVVCPVLLDKSHEPILLNPKSKGVNLKVSRRETTDVTTPVLQTISKPLITILLSFAFMLINVTNVYAANIWNNPDVILAFGDTYVSELGNNSRHSGMDVSLQTGTSITAPKSGTISFAGSVPSSEIPGSPTTLAVTIDIGDDKKISVMPLESIAVKEGDSVSVGDSLGLLAATGDKSSSAVHLHVSLREGSTYVDPSVLFTGITNTDISNAQSSENNAVTQTSAANDTASVQTSSEIAEAWDTAESIWGSAAQSSFSLETEESIDASQEAQLGTISSGDLIATGVSGLILQNNEDSDSLMEGESALLPSALLSGITSTLGDIGYSGAAVLALAGCAIALYQLLGSGRKDRRLGIRIRSTEDNVLPWFLVER